MLRLTASIKPLFGNRGTRQSGAFLFSCREIVESLKDEDCFQKAENVFAVSHIFVKPNDAKTYGEVLFQDKKAASVPGHALAFLDIGLREKFLGSI